MLIYKNDFKKFLNILFLIITILSISLPSFAQEKVSGDDAIASYQKNRQTFHDRQRETDQRFHQETSALKKEMNALEEKIAVTNDELVKIKSHINEQQLSATILKSVRSAIAMFLFPIAFVSSEAMSFLSSGWAGIDIMLSIFVSLTLLNLFLYIRFREKQFFEQYKIALIIALVIFISAIASPLFADDNLTKRKKTITKLILATKVLSQTDHERFIAILESWESNDPVKLDLSKLVSGDKLLTLFPQVILDTPEYYFTLAALYMHENKTGKAVDAIEKIIYKNMFKTGKILNMIAINSIKFLIQQNQTELAGKAVENLAKKISEVSVLLELAEFLQSNGMLVSDEKVLGYAIGRARTVKELVELSTFLFRKGKNDKGTEALEKALGRVNTVDQLVLVAKAAINTKKDNVIEQITKKAILISNFQERVRVMDLFLEHGRKEEAISICSEMIKNVKYKTPNKIRKLLFLIDVTLKRNLIPQAIKATERLFMYLGEKKYDYQIEAGHQLKSAKGLPNQDKITLPQFYGMLNEEMDYTDNAESQYIDNINSSLKHILESYGYDLPDSLNDYHLLGRIWIKENREELISGLDRLYTIIEEHFIEQQAMKNDGRLKGLRVKLQEKKVMYNHLLAEIEKTEKMANTADRKLIVRIVNIIATIVLLLAILVGCLMISFKHAKQLAMHKTFGFIIKFFEMTGWVRVFSLLGVMSGLMSILIAQFFQIIQCTQENTFCLQKQDSIKTILPDKQLQQSIIKQ